MGTAILFMPYRMFLYLQNRVWRKNIFDQFLGFGVVSEGLGCTAVMWCWHCWVIFGGIYRLYSDCIASYNSCRLHFATYLHVGTVFVCTGSRVAQVHICSLYPNKSRISFKIRVLTPLCLWFSLEICITCYYI